MKFSLDQARQALRADGVNDDTIDAFLAWYKKHPEVWLKFEEVALRGFNMGMKHWGAGGIAEVVRYELFKPEGADFVINNNYRAYLARILVAKYPTLKGKIKFRRVCGLRAPKRKVWKEQSLWE